MSRLSKKHLLKIEKCSPLLPNPGPEVVEELLGHIYALESELALNQAAIVREAAEKASDEVCDAFEGINDSPYPVAKRVSAAILAIPTDQPALDRHDAELKAQFAAMLEELLNAEWLHDYVKDQDGNLLIQRLCEDDKRHLRAFIPADYADALAKHDAELRAQYQAQILSSQNRATKFAEDYDKLEESVAERVREAKLEEAEFWYVTTKELSIAVREHVAAKRLAALRATASPKQVPK